jgi:hypothetical protein
MLPYKAINKKAPMGPITTYCLIKGLEVVELTKSCGTRTYLYIAKSDTEWGGAFWDSFGDAVEGIRLGVTILQLRIVHRPLQH